MTLNVRHAQLTELDDIRRAMSELGDMLRVYEDGMGSHTAAADLLLLSARTHTWFTVERNYLGRAGCLEGWLFGW